MYLLYLKILYLRYSLTLLATYFIPFSVRSHVQISDVVAVDQDGAGVDVVEALQQLDASGLPAAGGTNQCNGLALFHFQVDPLQNLVEL